MDKSIIEHFSSAQIIDYQQGMGWYSEQFPSNYRPETTVKSRLHPAVAVAIDAWRPDSDKPSLGLIGPPGIGKTRAAYLAILRYALDNPRKCCDEQGVKYLKDPHMEWISECDFAEAVSNSFNFDDKHEQEIAKLILSDTRRCEVLLLDDLGQAKYTERVQSELYRLIEYRSSEGKPFIWTSNYDAKGLLKKFPDPLRGKAILRRMKEFSTIVNVRE